MILKNDPDIQYAFRRNLAARDAFTFIDLLDEVDPNAAVGYLSGKLEATRGAWVRIGNYRIESDSFIDPSDLMLYVESYYEPDEGGPVEAVELNHGDVPAGALYVETLDALLDALAQLDYCEAPSEEGAVADAGAGAGAGAAVGGAAGAGAGGAAGGADTDAGAGAGAAAGAGAGGPAAEAAAGGPAAEAAAGGDGVPKETASADGTDAGGALEGEPPVMPSRLDGLTALEPSAASEMRGALTKGWHAMYYEAADGSSLLVLD